MIENLKCDCKSDHCEVAAEYRALLKERLPADELTVSLLGLMSRHNIFFELRRRQLPTKPYQLHAAMEEGAKLKGKQAAEFWSKLFEKDIYKEFTAQEESIKRKNIANYRTLSELKGDAVRFKLKKYEDEIEAALATFNERGF
jgi:hypothetical protein